MRFYFLFCLLVAKTCHGIQDNDEKNFETKIDRNQSFTHGFKSYSELGFTDKIGDFSIPTTRFDLITEENDNHTIRRKIRQALPEVCQQNTANCESSSKFRTQDGTCNNLRNVRWGSAPSPLTRIANPAYEDGVGVPRGGRQESRLPNPRDVSNIIHPDAAIANPSITNMVPQFGQFLDHDISLTHVNIRQCCKDNNDPECWTISIPSYDPMVQSPQPQTCIDFVRSTPWCFADTGVREQINMNTAFIDGSQIYGSSTQRTQSLRTFRGGRLITNTNGLNGFLPTSQAIGVKVQGTFVAGDDRVNETPALTVMHNLFIMEHNRIAAGLRELAPSWGDERLFQEARRIVGAELQQVTYNEYLPIILGLDSMQEYGLTLGNSYSTYDQTVNPSVINSFATAAYRFGHSLINGLVRLVNNRNAFVGQYRIQDQYFQSTQMTQSNGQGYDWILRGLMAQNSQECDNFVTDDVRNFLFKKPNATFGSDLVARNIQRGRDHGLPDYNTFRNICGLPSITSWAQRPDEIRADVWIRVQSVYQLLGLGLTPNDIDLFTGGLIENPVAGGITGPTFNCIMSVQFARLKFGDRFFFTHGNKAGSFTPAQAIELRKRTLGDIICQNSQQPSTSNNVFLTSSSRNPFVSCFQASRKLNLRPFIYQWG